MGQRPVKLPDYVHAFIDRHGRSRFYLRRKGHKKVPLPGLPWTPQFMEVYEAALAQPDKIEIGAARTKPGSLNAAVVRYYESTEFTKELAEGTQKSQRSHIERFRRRNGDKPLRRLERKHVQDYISRLESPTVQRNMLRALKHFLKFCVGAGLIDHNPAEGVTRRRIANTGGFIPWTEDHVTKFEERHPIGSTARLALALYLNLGVRKSDVVDWAAAHQEWRAHRLPATKDEPHRRQADHGAAASGDREVDCSDAAYWRRHVPGDVIRQAVHRQRFRQQDG